MRELSLFTGAGGGLLGSKLLGWKTVGYVEVNDYCQRVIARRIKDGILDEAPIYGDIRTFISEGYAASYKGMVDVVTGGFPCQPFSIAGKRLGEFDPRNMWPETIECIRIIRPHFTFLENVPMLLNYEYFGRILGDLAEYFFDTWGSVKIRCIRLGSGDSGGVQIGRRIWILASPNECNRDANEKIHPPTNFEKQIRRRDSWPALQDAKTSFLLSNAFIVPKDYEVAHWVDEFRAIGNGQDPVVVKRAWELLIGV